MIPRSQAKSCKGGWQSLKHGDANAQLIINLTSCAVVYGWLGSCTAIAVAPVVRIEHIFTLSFF